MDGMGHEKIGQKRIQQGAVVTHEYKGWLYSVENLKPQAFGLVSSANKGTVAVPENPGKKIAVCRAVTPGTDHGFSSPGSSIGEKFGFGKAERREGL
jgi:hypothetical protein